MVSLLMSLDCFSKFILESDKTYAVPMENNRQGRASSATDSEEDKYVLEAWKRTFYNIYGEKFKGMSNTTLIQQERYNFIVRTLQIISAYPIDQKLSVTEKIF